jgi:pimeloyl-ACP methyl ester carboxylesterase
MLVWNARAKGLAAVCTLVAASTLVVAGGAGGAGGAGQTPQAAGQAASPRVDPYLPKPTGLSEVDLATLKLELGKLGDAIDRLKAQYATGPLHDRLADVEVFWSAVHNQIQHDERTDLARAQRAIQMGLDRAAALASGAAPWMTENGIRGFYSKIDGSAQPYLLNVPVNFTPGLSRSYRLDVFCHGRDEGTYDLNFMFGKSTTNFNGMPLTPGPDRFILQPFGRYSNASRFAGETDVLEAIDAVSRAYAIDGRRVVMSGFSMGGASAWQFAVHYTDRWAVASAGAGFTETVDFLKLTPEKMPPSYQQTLWHMYDVKDYALNTFNTPIVAYSGEIDAQKQAADVMEAAMRAEGLTLEHLIGPKTGHAYEPATRLKLIARIDELVAKGRDLAPKTIKFTTWMLRYHKMYWLEIDGLREHWTRARVDARVDGTTITLTTANVSALHLNWTAGLAPAPAGQKLSLVIDGTTLTLPPVAPDRSLNAGVVSTSGGWRLGTLPADALRKAPGLQGPIDDAFMDSFMFVRPTGRPLNPAVGQWAADQLAYATSEWQGVFRGDPRVKDDTAVGPADIAAHNLVLFGDPSSNAVFKKIAGKLPIGWTAESVTVGRQKFPADTHVPVLIFPNPLNPRKYVVINSGFTFHDQFNNDLQAPKLPDWAIVNITERGSRQLPLSVKAQGFFDESWRIKER